MIEKKGMKNIVILLFLFVSLIVFGFQLRKKQSDIEYLEQLMVQIFSATDVYWVENGRVYPESLDDLIHGGYLSEDYYAYHEKEIRGFYIVFDYGDFQTDGYEYSYMIYKPDNEAEKRLGYRSSLYLKWKGLYARDGEGIVNRF